ncbi:MAG: nucleotidyltransferase family protein, partial [Alphaproteobacteria bacterium]
ETGGGVRRALGWLGDGPFFVANGDVIWRDGPRPALGCLAAAWDDGRMDALLLLQAVERAIGYDGAGDFAADAQGRLTRSRGRSPFVFAGVQVLHPRLFDGSPEGAFSLNLLYDRALAAGRLFGLAHDGPWYHVGTPEGLAEAERALGPAAPAGT